MTGRARAGEATLATARGAAGRRRAAGAPRAGWILGLAAALPGCQSFVSELGHGIGEAVFIVGSVVLGCFGLAGVGMILEAARGRVSRVVLSVQVVVGLLAIALTGIATSGFSPWPGDFPPRAIAWLWLPAPLGAAAFVSLGRSWRERGGSARVARAIALGGSGALLVALAHASLAVLPRGYAGRPREIAVTDHAAYVRGEGGELLLLRSGREQDGRFVALRGGSRGAVAIDLAGHLVAFPGLQGPVRVPLAAPARAIAAGPRFDAVVDANGRVFGFDVTAKPESVEAFGWFGPVPRAVPALGEVDAVSVSGGLVCAHREGGRAACVPAPTSGGSALFEADDAGNLARALAAPDARQDPRPPRVRVLLERGARGTAATTASACVLDEGGRVACAGDDENGEVSLQRKPAPTATLTPIAGLPVIAQIVAGEGHVCARAVDGAVVCWGAGAWGQLGSAQAPGPARIDLPAPAEELFGFEGSTCARLSDRTFHCWGGQREPGAVVTQRLCAQPLFAANVSCSEAPELVPMPTTYLPARPRAE